MHVQVGGRTDIPPDYVPSPAPADSMSRAVEMLWVRERAQPKERAGAPTLRLVKPKLLKEADSISRAVEMLWVRKSAQPNKRAEAQALTLWRFGW